MTKTIIISYQVTQTIEVPDDSHSESWYTQVTQAVYNALNSDDYLRSATPDCVFVRTRISDGSYGRSIPIGNGSSQPVLSTLNFDNVVEAWNSNWRYINKNANDWPFVSAFTSVSESYVPEMSTVFPKVEREEIYPLWRNYTKELFEIYEKFKMETFRKMICEHFDGMREDGLRECTPVKKSYHDHSM